MAKFSLHYTNTYLKDLKLARRRRLDEERAEMKATYEALKSVCDFM